MNYDLFKQELRKKNVTYEEMADCLSMDISTFYRKMSESTSPFSIKDAEIIKKKLELSRTKAIQIFFEK